MGPRGLTGGVQVCRAWAPGALQGVSRASRGSENGTSNSSINLSGLGSSSKLYIEEFLEEFSVLLLIKSFTNSSL
jgi:hypothetical protein